MELTKRQQQILDVVQGHIAERGYPPTVREIGEAVGLTSSATVHAHLHALEARGALRRDPAKPRALDVARRQRDEPRATRMIPLIGEIAAGAPIVAEERIEERIPLPDLLTTSGDCFMLRVRGDSMIDAGILDGDYVVIRKQDDCDDEDIVAALVDDEDATVKRLRRVGGRVQLVPENPHLEPFFPDRVAVLGKVVSVFRRL